MSATVFVTVGSTKFEELIEAVYRDDTLIALKNKGYSKIIFQVGNGKFKPPENIKCGVEICVFTLKPSVLEYFESADLVISHAGAGSCLEALNAKTPLITVINDKLMDNHQLELAEELFSQGYCLYCTPKTLHATIVSFDSSQLKPYQGGNPQLLADYLNSVFIIKQ